jgi:histidine triad (HIT) family protein
MDVNAQAEYSDTCIFCKLAKGLVRADIIYQDSELLAFRDIHPQAPVHVLIIPRTHITALWDADDTDAVLMGRLLLAANTIAEQEGINESGYRVVTNAGSDAGQSVDHLHLHVLGGRKLEWPPG